MDDLEILKANIDEALDAYLLACGLTKQQILDLNYSEYNEAIDALESGN